jgi:hypothetical protein
MRGRRLRGLHRNPNHKFARLIRPTPENTLKSPPKCGGKLTSNRRIGPDWRRRATYNASCTWVAGSRCGELS